MFKITPVILFVIASAGCVTAPLQHQHSVAETSEKVVYKTEDFSRLILPFKAFAYKADYHVMAYFNDHDVYEAVEAFIFLIDGTYEFKAIMTKHDQSQIDYISSERLLSKKEGGTKIVRLVKTTSGSFNLSDNGKDYDFSFALDENTQVGIHYIGFSAPGESMAGMTNPGGHSPSVGLPMMYRSHSSIGTEACYVEINGAKYSITEDPDISKKPFFTAYKTFLTNDFFFSIIPSHSTTQEVLLYIPGQEHIVLETPVGQKLVHVNEYNEVLDICYYSNISSDQDSYMQIAFFPALPNLAAMQNDQNQVIDFIVSYSNSEKNEVYGKIEIHKNVNGNISMRLIPGYPEWAGKNRVMNYDIMLTDNLVTIEAWNVN